VLEPVTGLGPLGELREGEGADLVQGGFCDRLSRVARVGGLRLVRRLPPTRPRRLLPLLPPLPALPVIVLRRDASKSLERVPTEVRHDGAVSLRPTVLRFGRGD